MFTKNAKAFFIRSLYGDTYSIYPVNTNSSTVECNYSSTSLTNFKTVYPCTELVEIDRNTPKGIALLFGNGNTPANENDITLDNIITNYTHRATNVTVSDYKGYAITRTIQNDTSDNIIVREVGLFYAFSGNWYLLAREVLDGDIVIKPGEVKTFTMCIDM